MILIHRRQKEEEDVDPIIARTYRSHYCANIHQKGRNRISNINGDVTINMKK